MSTDHVSSDNEMSTRATTEPDDNAEWSAAKRQWLLGRFADQNFAAVTRHFKESDHEPTSRSLLW